MQGLVEDPWILAQIDAAVAPYARHLPEGEIAWMRERLAEALASDGHVHDVLRRARPRVVERSGEVSVTPASDERAPVSMGPQAAPNPGVQRTPSPAPTRRRAG